MLRHPGNAGAPDYGCSPGQGLRPPVCGGQGLDARTCCRPMSLGPHGFGHLPRTRMCRTASARRDHPRRVSQTYGTATTGSHATRYQGLCGQFSEGQPRPQGTPGMHSDSCRMTGRQERHGGTTAWQQRRSQRWPQLPPYSSFWASGGAPSRARPRSGRSCSASRACAASIRDETCKQYPLLHPEQPVRTSAEGGLRPLHCLSHIITRGHRIAGARGSSRGDPLCLPAPCRQPSTPWVNEPCSVKAFCTSESGHRKDRAQASECTVLPARMGRVRGARTG